MNIPKQTAFDSAACRLHCTGSTGGRIEGFLLRKIMNPEKPMRKPMSKKLRFSVFARDAFTCRYCGRQSDTVELHVDHVIPVCKGGTNNEMNLVTSCADCNLGKGSEGIEQSAPTETDRLRMAQEMQEQRKCATIAKEAMAARKERKQDLINFWIDSTGRVDAHADTISTVFSYVIEYGEEIVYSWIEKAEAKCHNDQNMGRYISGIRRCVKSEEGEA